MSAKPTTVKEYLAALPEDRRSAIETVRKIMLKNLDSRYVEGISYGMISYCVPHSLYPAGYHCDPKQALPFACLGSQKNYMVLHLMCLYACDGADTPAARLLGWFQTEWAKTGKKLDMGKACIRFKKADDLALDTIAKAIAKVPASKWIADTQTALASRKKPERKATPSKPGTAKAARAGK